MDREYGVLVRGKDGGPISGAIIKINGREYTTDENGEAMFTLVLDEDNYNQAQELQAYHSGRLIAEENIDFFTDTPIIIS